MKEEAIVGDFIYLLSCALNSDKADILRINKMNLDDIFSLADYHKLASCAAFSFDDELLKEDSFKSWKQAKSMAVRKNIMLNNEREQIYSYMEENSVKHASLKGVVMQNYYPKFCMREMGDNDILYDSAYQEQIHDYMISHGYHAEVYKRFHHDEYLKPPIYNFEFHNSLFIRSKNEVFYNYYSDIMDRLLSVKGKNFEYRFSDEDFYIYNVAHSYQHYISGGTGLRILTDCYVYLRAKSESLDFKYIENESRKIGIYDYEQICRGLSQKLFSVDNQYSDKLDCLNKDEKEILNRFISSGAYGKQEFVVENKINELSEKGKSAFAIKTKYYFKRIFLSMNTIRDEYPFFYKYKFLIPCLLIYRIIRILTFDRKRLKSELASVDMTIENMKKK